jgi:transcriptional regulator with XRE-family HTH domain
MSVFSTNAEAREIELGRTIRRWRIAAGLSQEEAAERASLSRSAVQALERGTGSRVATLIRVLRAIGRDDALDVFSIDETPSPIELLAAQRRAERSETDAPRASRRR